MTVNRETLEKLARFLLRGLLRLLAHPGLQRLAQIVAWLQPQRHHLHGVGPSISPWNITRAST